MLDGHFHRGFSAERLALNSEPKVRRDHKGYYIMSLSENVKVYFDDYYDFLSLTYDRCKQERLRLDTLLATTPESRAESIAYFRARAVLVDLLMRTIRRFYVDGANLGVVMTPWCFGTVVLEKVEVYRERLTKGDIQDPNIPEYPYYVIRYIDEIYKPTLLELFDFPEPAFHMRWQYSELLKRYSRVLTDISSSLQSVLMSIKNYGT
jgi:hypothetical protein